MNNLTGKSGRGIDVNKKRGKECPDHAVITGTVFERSALRLAEGYFFLIDPFLEFLTNLEKGSFLGETLMLFPVLGFLPVYRRHISDDKASESLISYGRSV